jgi:hypothetical protein
LKVTTPRLIIFSCLPLCISIQLFHTFKKGKWQYYNSNAGRFDFQRFHEGQHWYPSSSGKIAADDRAKVDAIEFLRERPKEKPFAMTVAL